MLAVFWHIRACASTGFLVRACGYTTATRAHNYYGDTAADTSGVLVSSTPQRARVTLEHTTWFCLKSLVAPHAQCSILPRCYIPTNVATL